MMSRIPPIPNAATISPPAVTETTPEEENQYYYN
jgi:hypothetical protein